MHAVVFSFHANINLWSKVIFVLCCTESKVYTRIYIHYTYSDSTQKRNAYKRKLWKTITTTANHEEREREWGKKGEHKKLAIRIFRSRKLFIVLLLYCIRFGNFMSGETLENAEQKLFILLLYFVFYLDNVAWKCIHMKKTNCVFLSNFSQRSDIIAAIRQQLWFIQWFKIQWTKSSFARFC